jgi:acetyltransferase-like isoleucine patch superfamily enzyme
MWYFFNKRRFIKLGVKSFVNKPIIITPFCVEIRDHVFIQANARIEGVINYENVKFNPQIVFDDYCTIQQNLHLTCAKSIYIGKNTAIAANVTITDINHPYEDIDVPIEKQLITVKPVYISENCKIYNNVVVLPGTYMGKHCTIGANSVVSGNIPDFSVLVGAPAKIVKRYCFKKKEWLKTDKQGNFIKEI